jgi:hypothetical protein
MKYFITIICCLLLSISHYAQDTTGVKEVTTGLRADGKIYVVVAVVVTILLGLVIYLISLDRKIARIEKQNM